MASDDQEALAPVRDRFGYLLKHAREIFSPSAREREARCRLRPAMRAVCDARLWHNRGRGADTLQPVLSHAQMRLYAQLLAMTERPNTLPQSDYPLPSDWRRRLLDQEAAADPTPDQ